MANVIKPRTKKNQLRRESSALFKVLNSLLCPDRKTLLECPATNQQMKLHSPMSSKLQVRPPILCQRLAKAELRSTTNLPSKSSTMPPPDRKSILSIGNRPIRSPLHLRCQVLGDQETPTSSDDDPMNIFKRTVKFVNAFWRLLRPFVLYELIIAAFSWAARAFLAKPHGQQYGLSTLQGLSALFVMVCCLGTITGLNQIYDRDIDIINKPFLPISSGDLSVNTAWTLVLSMAASGFAVAVANGARPLIISFYCIYIAIVGVLYSVPPFRLKRFAFGAYLAIAAHGAILNLGLYHALKDTVNFPFQWNFQMTFITTFSTLLGVVFGLTKDLSDIEGDRKHNIMTPAVVLGPRKTTFLGVGILLSMYAVVMAATISMPHVFRGTLMVPAHGLFSMFLILQVWLLEKANYSKEACLKFYLALWYLRYAEFLVFSFM